MKVLVYSNHPYEREYLDAVCQDHHELEYTDLTLGPDTTMLADGFDAISLFSSDDASAEVLQKLDRRGIKYIALRSTGFDNVDLKVAEQLDIHVAHVPDYSPNAIAEHAVALLLALNRKIYDAQLLLQQQDFRLDTLIGFDLHNKTVGIVGTGRIGFYFAKIMHGFGCQILAHDPVRHPDASSLDIQYVDLRTLLTKSDVVSLHCPLNDSTFHLIDRKALGLMKETAILINTARGAIVDTQSLLEALETMKLGGACLDVYEGEKGLFFMDHRQSRLADHHFARLRNLKNVLMTGHQAFLTEEALFARAKTIIQNLLDWEQEGRCANELTFRDKAMT